MSCIKCKGKVAFSREAFSKFSSRKGLTGQLNCWLKRLKCRPNLACGPGFTDYFVRMKMWKVWSFQLQRVKWMFTNDVRRTFLLFVALITLNAEAGSTLKFHFVQTVSTLKVSFQHWRSHGGLGPPILAETSHGIYWGEGEGSMIIENTYTCKELLVYLFARWSMIFTGIQKCPKWPDHFGTVATVSMSL